MSDIVQNKFSQSGTEDTQIYTKRTPCMQRIAYKSVYYELVRYIEKYCREYWSFIMMGTKD